MTQMLGQLGRQVKMSWGRPSPYDEDQATGENRGTKFKEALHFFKPPYTDSEGLFNFWLALLWSFASPSLMM